jgi:hypothetical protein
VARWRCYVHWPPQENENFSRAGREVNRGGVGACGLGTHLMEAKAGGELGVVGTRGKAGGEPVMWVHVGMGMEAKSGGEPGAVGARGKAGGELGAVGAHWRARGEPVTWACGGMGKDTIEAKAGSRPFSRRGFYSAGGRRV